MTTSSSSGSASSELTRLFAVCWPANTPANAAVVLDFSHADDVGFDTQNGATNSTARCMREIAFSVPAAERPHGQLTVSPGEAPSGWAILAWVKRVSMPVAGNASITDPAPLIAGCLTLDGGIRKGLKAAVGFEPALESHLSLGGRHGSASTDAERCVLAVLGSTKWPSTRPYELDLPESDLLKPAPNTAFAAAYDSAHGFTGPTRDALQVKSAFAAELRKVSACWEDAISRRAGLAGGRTVRLQVDASGAQTKVAVAPFAGDGLEVSDELLDRCLLDVASAVKLPAGEAGQASYSWIFAERG
ncbi:MAG: hypothetical protein QM723_02185 [Myxococcaceae bacterium]